MRPVLADVLVAERNTYRGVPASRYAQSRIAAMTIPASTNTTIAAWVQSQKGDMPAG